MKIFLAQQNYHIGNFEENAAKVIDGINKAKAAGADLVMFSELCICGYPPRDFLEFDDFINKCYESIDIIKQYADTIGVLIGSPARNTQLDGKDLFIRLGIEGTAGSSMLRAHNRIQQCAWLSALQLYPGTPFHL